MWVLFSPQLYRSVGPLPINRNFAMLNQAGMKTKVEFTYCGDFEEIATLLSVAGFPACTCAPVLDLLEI